MILFGHKFIPNHSFYHILNIDSILHTPPSSTIYLEFNEENLEIIEHTKLNNISIALKISTLNELIFASALGARYIMVPKESAKEFQDIAENYLFDAKILVNIEEDSEITELALLGIDGVFYSNAIVKTNG